MQVPQLLANGFVISRRLLSARSWSGCALRGLWFAVSIAALFLWAASTKAGASIADAVEKLDRPRIQQLLGKHPGTNDVNAAQADGMTALHWATHHNDPALVKALLKEGASVRAENRYGVTPLALACQNGNASIIEALLNAGADPNAAGRGGETALMTAARTGKVEPVKLLLARGADANAKERRGQTAIMWAAADGHAEVVDLLIKAGADFKTPLEGGFTPLFFAVREGRLEAAKVLVKAGADVNATMEPKRPGGRAPQKGMTPLLLAVENGHFELAIFLVQSGADPNDQRGGYTALHNITWVRKANRGDDDDGGAEPTGSGNLSSLQFVRKMVELGADVNARIKKGRGGKGLLNTTEATPFLLASRTADIALLKLLVELGADPKLTNVDGSTPLMAAAGLGTLAPDEEAGTEEECVEVLDYLYKLGGSDINAVDKNGETAMHGAAYKSLPKVAAWLAAHGAKVEIWNQKDKYGWTPLLIAEGYRPGNFKPSFETIDAIRAVMTAAGVTPPEKTVAKDLNNDNYAPKKAP